MLKFITHSFLTTLCFFANIKQIDFSPEQKALNIVKAYIDNNIKKEKVFFTGKVDNRISFISKKLSDIPISICDTSGISYLYNERNDTIVGDVHLKCLFSKKSGIVKAKGIVKGKKNLTIYKAYRMNNRFYFVRALVTNGWEGELFYFFIGDEEVYFQRYEYVF